MTRKFYSMPGIYSLSGIVLFLLSLGYLGAELVFNGQLLDISSSVRSDPAQVEHVQYFGRIVSGIGFTLMVLGFFQRFNFKLLTKEAVISFIALVLLCLMPFFMVFSGMLFFGHHDMESAVYGQESAWALVPLLGIYVALTGRGRKALPFIIGLVLMAWPTMFYGQKLAVERFLIAPTSAEDRLNAHYILLIRAGVEDCIVSLEDTPFCDTGEKDGSVEKRSTRAVLGALFMLNSQAVFKSMSFVREQIIDKIAERDLWFSSKEYYQRYLAAAAKKREEYQAYLNQNFYLPYKQASDLYFTSMARIAAARRQIARPVDDRLAKTADDAAAEAAAEIDKAWQQYQAAVSQYNNLAYNALSQAIGLAQPGLQAYDSTCDGRKEDCRRVADKGLRHIKSTGVINRVKEEGARQVGSAAQKFTDKTGYPPDLKDKEAFIRHPRTQKEIHDKVQESIRRMLANDNYVLPQGWTYDPGAFRGFILGLAQAQAKAVQDSAEAQVRQMQSAVEKEWHDKIQAPFNTDIQPGLTHDQFFRKLGVDPSPSLQDLTLSEGDFMKKYIVPMNRAAAAAALQHISDEEPDYANGGSMAEQGKDYIRVLYIPAIALCFSLTIVVLTIGRYLVAFATRYFTSRLPKNMHPQVRPVCWAAFLVFVLTLPYAWPNAYTASPAYQKYYHLAREKEGALALVLDWVVHMQPLVYHLAPSKRL